MKHLLPDTNAFEQSVKSPFVITEKKTTVNYPGRKIVFLLMMLFTSGLFAQNIMITNQGTPNEPSIMMDPKNPRYLVAGTNTDNCFVSADTGRTWTKKTISSTYGVAGDPVIVVDTNGSFYYFHLSNPSSGGHWLDRMVCQKSTNKGSTWSNGTYTGLNGAKQQDKQWCIVDRKNNNMYLTWTQFDKYGSTSATDKTNILFSRSVDAGATWSTAVQINKVPGDCIDDDKTVEGAVPAVGPNGEVYVSWAGPNGIVFNKSLDKGVTWLSNEIAVDPMPGGWNFNIPGINRTNGMPVTICDLSNGPNRGTIYINWADQRNGNTNTDIWLSKSTDGGASWSSPKRVNDDNSKRHQFLTHMSVDQTNGYLYFVFYDRRAYSDNSTDVYVALSIDGGETFLNKKISESPFLPTSDVFFGDYNNITAHNGIIRPIWTRLNNGKLSIWTDLTDVNDILLSTEEIAKSEYDVSFENYPNPSGNYTFASFKLRERATINLQVFDVNGKMIQAILKDQKREPGGYIERIDLDNLNVPSGTYFLKLQVDEQVKIMRQIVIK
jgi:hypothetical protein